mmetsp:Transcript_119356/g.382553  ORF Transcript_119356/g.382553 Transcript_119356/m.382553 type:complete len:274 (+) Transcript_119356:397-1218(+)
MPMLRIHPSLSRAACRTCPNQLTTSLQVHALRNLLVDHTAIDVVGLGRLGGVVVRVWPAHPRRLFAGIARDWIGRRNRNPIHTLLIVLLAGAELGSLRVEFEHGALEQPSIDPPVLLALQEPGDAPDPILEAPGRKRLQGLVEVHPLGAVQHRRPEGVDRLPIDLTCHKRPRAADVPDQRARENHGLDPVAVLVHVLQQPRQLVLPAPPALRRRAPRGAREPAQPVQHGIPRHLVLEGDETASHFEDGGVEQPHLDRIPQLLQFDCVLLPSPS